MQTDMLKKICRGCWRELPLTAYFYHKGGRDGRRSRCKECCRKAAAARNAKEKARGPEYLRSSLKSIFERVLEIDQAAERLRINRAAVLRAAGDLLKANGLRKATYPGVGSMRIENGAVSIVFEDGLKES